MTDAAVQRKNMVDSQVRPSDVTDRRIINAMLEVPREQYLPAAKAAVAYMDSDVPLAGGRALLGPRTFAKLMQLATIESGDHVLDVGALGGYSTAVIARLAKSVVALEADQSHAGSATPKGEFGPVAAVTGPLAQGWAKAGPYDVIVLEGAVETVPELVFQQLKPGGRLVAVLADAGASRATLWQKAAHGVVNRPGFDATAQLLPGFARVRTFAL